MTEWDSKVRGGRKLQLFTALQSLYLVGQLRAGNKPAGAVDGQVTEKYCGNVSQLPTLYYVEVRLVTGAS